MVETTEERVEWGAPGQQDRELVFQGDRASIQGDENVPDMDGGGRTAT